MVRPSGPFELRAELPHMGRELRFQPGKVDENFGRWLKAKHRRCSRRYQAWPPIAEPAGSS